MSYESPFIICDEVPTSADLAIENPASEMHGHGPKIMKELGHWHSMQRSAIRDTHITNYLIADTLGMELLRVLPWTSERHLNASEMSVLERLENGSLTSSQHALSRVALSSLMRFFMGQDGGPVIPIRGVMDPEDGDLLFDMEPTNDASSPVRMHIAPTLADTCFGGQLESDELWLQHPNGLYVKRTPLDVSAGMEEVNRLGNVTLNPDLQTVFPYLPAQPA